MGDAWDTFIASLDLATLEQERMRPPLDMRLERSDGAEDVRMRHWHDEQRRRFHWGMAVQESHFEMAQRGVGKPWERKAVEQDATHMSRANEA